MKLKNYFLGLSVAVMGLLTSCDQDNEGPVYGGTTMGVTFAINAQSVSFPATGYEGFDVEVIRAVSDEAATVPLNASMADGSAVPSEIQVPANVNFEAGEFTATVHVTVGDITPGENYRLVLSLGEETAPVDAILQKTITIYRDYTYSSIGTGTYTSTFFTLEDGSPQSFPVEVMQADQNPSLYKAIAVYEEGYDIVFQVGADGRTVLVARQAACSDINGYGTAYVAGNGTLENGVITVTLEFSVSAGSFTPPAIETLQLPTAGVE